MQPSLCNFIKKETLVQVFSCEFCVIFKNIFLQHTFRWLLLDISLFQLPWANVIVAHFVRDMNFSFLNKVLYMCPLGKIPFMNCIAQILLIFTLFGKNNISLIYRVHNSHEDCGFEILYVSMWVLSGYSFSLPVYFAHKYLFKWAC